MSTLAEQPVSPATASGWRVMPEQRLLLLNVSWQAYVTMADALPDRPYLRRTYDRGRLEFMTTSPEHEIYKVRFGRFLETLAEEMNLCLVGCGQMTFRRADLERSFEPDQCYWIAHEKQMRGLLEWDPARDPAPDLILEIEISRSALSRMSIFAAMGVPEVWRFDGRTLTIHLLQPDQSYQVTTISPTFPGIDPAGIAGRLRPSPTEDSLTEIRSFRAWVRQQIAPPAGPNAG